jgi:hypothetical protein
MFRRVWRAVLACTPSNYSRSGPESLPSLSQLVVAKARNRFGKVRAPSRPISQNVEQETPLLTFGAVREPLSRAARQRLPGQGGLEACQRRCATRPATLLSSPQAMLSPPADAMARGGRKCSKLRLDVTRAQHRGRSINLDIRSKYTHIYFEKVGELADHLPTELLLAGQNLGD